MSKNNKILMIRKVAGIIMLVITVAAIVLASKGCGDPSCVDPQCHDATAVLFTLPSGIAMLVCKKIMIFT